VVIGSRSVMVGGSEFGFLVAGERTESVPVLLLHATGETSESWMNFLSRWGRRGGLAYALDLRGHGRSVWSGPYGLETFAEDVLGFMDAMNLGVVDVVGHSIGGLVGCLVAARAPERVRKLVLEDVGIPYPRETVVMEKPTVPLDFDWDMVGRVRAQIDNPDSRWASWVAQVQADTLVVAGGPSSSVPQEHVGEMAGTIPGAQLVTIAGGHMVHETRPEHFSVEVIAHLTAEAQ
jgi:pimeloyl-ACP methyl ester carboxylesterase